MHDSKHGSLALRISRLALERESLCDKRALVLTDFVDERCKKASRERLPRAGARPSQGFSAPAAGGDDCIFKLLNYPRESPDATLAT